MTEFSLASAFPPVTEADWRAIVGKALGGAGFDALRTSLYEGFQTEPLYTERGRAPALHGNRGWLIIQPVVDERQAADDLAGGAGALVVDFEACPAIQIKDDLKPYLGAGSLYVAPAASLAGAALILAAANGDVKGSAGFDPLTAYALTGELPADRSALLADYVDAALAIRERAPSFVPFLVRGRGWHGAGGSATEELAFMLSAAVSYWRALVNAGLPAGEAARCIGFSLSASSDIFIGIAAFRALRLLWARALAAAGESPNPDLLLLGRMSPRNLSAYDPHVNILRATAAAFAAGVGGAVGIELLPFDTVSTGATEVSRRLARNIGLVLQEEAWLTAVADPAAGSSAIEALTGQLAASAWALFREVEAQGGLAAALENGFVAEKLRRPADAQERAIARRREKITGVSVFPNLSEAPPALDIFSVRSELGRLAIYDLQLPAPGKGERFTALVEAAASGSALSDLRTAAKIVGDPSFIPLDWERRDAELFEALRQRADVALARIGSRPPIFLALLGKPADYRARANWVQGFFAAGGIQVLVPEKAFETAEELGEAFKLSPAPVACLCSSNAVYGSMEGAATALKTAGALVVYLAGPAAALRALSVADKGAVDRLIYEGCNALAVLQEAQQMLRVEELSDAAVEATERFEVYAEVETARF